MSFSAPETAEADRQSAAVRPYPLPGAADPFRHGEALSKREVDA